MTTQATIETASINASKLHKSSFTPKFSVKKAFESAKIQEQLRTGIGVLKFMKKDKTISTRRCTLRPDLLPQREKKITTKKESSTAILHFFCLEKQAFRCTKIENIISFKMES